MKRIGISFVFATALAATACTEESASVGASQESLSWSWDSCSQQPTVEEFYACTFGKGAKVPDLTSVQIQELNALVRDNGGWPKPAKVVLDSNGNPSELQQICFPQGQETIVDQSCHVEGCIGY